MKKFLMALLGFSLSSVAFANAPFEVSLRSNPFYGYAMVDIVSDTDGLVITDVVANRGKCGKSELSAYNPKELDFSDKASYHIRGCREQNIREIVVKTNQGDYSYSTRQ